MNSLLEKEKAQIRNSKVILPQNSGHSCWPPVIFITVTYLSVHYFRGGSEYQSLQVLNLQYLVNTHA
jgi:hypothetical protein